MKDGRNIKCKNVQNVNPVFYGNGRREKSHPNFLFITRAARQRPFKLLADVLRSGSRNPPRAPSDGSIERAAKAPLLSPPAAVPRCPRERLCRAGAVNPLGERIPARPGFPLHCRIGRELPGKCPRPGPSPLRSCRGWAGHTDLPQVQGISAGILLPLPGSRTEPCQEAQLGINKGHRLPGQAVKSPSLGMFQDHLDTVLGRGLWDGPAGAGAGTRGAPVVPSGLTHPGIK